MHAMSQQRHVDDPDVEAATLRVRQYLKRAEAMLHEGGIIGASLDAVTTLAAMLQRENLARTKVW